MRILLFIVAFMAACTPAYLKEDRWNSDGYTLTFRDVAGDTTTFEYQLLTDVPPERMWNIVTDIEGVFEVTNNFEVIDGPTRIDAQTVRTVTRVKPFWFAPSVTSVIIGRVLPQRLGWENECVESVLKACYMVWSVVPFDGGKRSMIKASGYMKRPWFVTHGHMVDLLRRNIRALGPGVQLIAARSKYDAPNKLFPWRDLASLNAEAEARPVAKVETRRRVALQHLQVFPQAVTNEAVGAVTTDYLATRLTSSGAFEVVTPSDMDVMARYLGEHWALICKDDDQCGQKLARMAESRFLLSGELRIEPSAYHVSLVMLDENKGAAVWRMQKSLPPDMLQVKRALDEATAELSHTELQ